MQPRKPRYVKQNEKSGKDSTGQKEEFRIGQKSGSAWALSKGSQTFKKRCLRFSGSGLDLMGSGAGNSRQTVNQTVNPELVSIKWKGCFLPLGSHMGEVRSKMGCGEDVKQEGSMRNVTLLDTNTQ